jgi:predicted nucleic acid-binding protein
MIVLDTSVISELMRPLGDPHVLAWVDELQAGEVYVTAVTAAELRYGVLRLPDGRRKSGLADRIQHTLAEDFAGRILSFDGDASTHYADIVVGREQRGLPITMADAQVAAICRCHTASLATRNTKDFAHTGVNVIDPWRAETHH